MVIIMENTHEGFTKKMGYRIMKIRLERHYSREFLAELADISPKFLYEIEIGKKGCSSYILYMLARSLKVDINCLLFDENEMVNSDFYILYKLLDKKKREKVDLVIKNILELTIGIE